MEIDGGQKKGCRKAVGVMAEWLAERLRARGIGSAEVIAAYFDEDTSRANTWAFL